MTLIFTLKHDKGYELQSHLECMTELAKHGEPFSNPTAMGRTYWEKMI